MPSLTNRKVLLAGMSQPKGTGWLPPVYNPRVLRAKDPELKPMLNALKGRLTATKSKALTAPPPKVDLRAWCTPIEDQGGLGSCTAHAAVGVVEYYETRSQGKYIDGSRLFVYKTTRNILGVTGDTGAWLRNALGALLTCGIPHEHYWPYTDADPAFDAEPPPFVYAIADNYETLKYWGHDPVADSVPRPAVLASVQKYLAAGVPSMFGFWGFASFDKGDQPGHIPLPSDQEIAGSPAWGHAIVAVGYDNKRKITNTATNVTTTGALLIRNSWGTAWGDGGYGWMPYEYLLRSIALDFWSMLSMEWADTDVLFAE